MLVVASLGSPPPQALNRTAAQIAAKSPPECGDKDFGKEVCMISSL
jgi:hypothetical protein